MFDGPHVSQECRVRNGMTYYPDLSEYSYLPDRLPAVNVGWLDGRHPFDTCDLALDIRNRIREIVAVEPVNRTRGFHVCDLCPTAGNRPPIIIEWQGQTRELGSAEIRVPSRSGRTYACPDLIIHYVDVHHYCPPDEFLRALRELESNASNSVHIARTKRNA